MGATVHTDQLSHDDQTPVVDFLATAATYGRPADVVERVDTHISIVFLVGDRAYKMKRAVLYDYVDFSTVEKRRVACEEEVRVNRRTAPGIYVGVVPITRAHDGGLALGGTGDPVEWLVEMVRFDQAGLFDRLAEEQALDLALMPPLARAIASMHAGAEPCDRGGVRGMRWVIDGNAAAFDAQAAGLFDRGVCERVSGRAHAAVTAWAGLLEDRRHEGLVRRCHGDLHLRNICLIGGAPTVFDAVEFNDEISCIDVWYDFAFLLMDLWRRRLARHANLVFNEYSAQTGDVAGLRLLPLYLSCRAAVRAKTSAAAVRLQASAERCEDLVDASRRYLALADQFLRPRAACLVAVGGWSGSGKTTLARRIAPSLGPVPGALVLRSDVVRKELMGVASSTRLGPDAYVPDVTQRVYRALADRARAAIGSGHAVVLDATFGEDADRRAVRRVAEQAGVPFAGVWLDGNSRVMAERIHRRVGDASDATPEVLERQVGRDVGGLDWTRLNASADVHAVARAAQAALDAAGVPYGEPE